MVTAKCFLFGSMARGDADAASDRDVLIVYKHESSESSRQKIKGSVTEQLQQDCAFAEYTLEHLLGMFRDGHLFAWHLYYEARPLRIHGIGDQDFFFPKPAPYIFFRRDALNFFELLESCVHSVERRTASLVYEAGLAYVAIRNIGMSLGAVALPRPEFDRYVPFKVARALNTRPPCDSDVYDLLIAARHSSQRGLDPPHLDGGKLLSSLQGARDWADEVLEIINDEKNIV